MAKFNGRLWVTEKPDMAKHLIAGLKFTYGWHVENPSSARSDGYFQLSNGDRVSYFFGHMVEMVGPNHYLNDTQRQSRNFFDFLPLIPETFVVVPKADRDQMGKPKLRDGKPVPPRQYHVLGDLMRGCTQIINAGDIDREGQLIVDELLLHFGIDPRGSTKPIHRLSISSTKEEDIQAQLTKGFDENGCDKWLNKRYAAGERQACDWLWGMNLSMAYQMLTGYRRLSVGRVQTPTLGMVVNRDLQIENFKPVNYFVPVITLADGTTMRWFKREGSEGKPGFDQEGRIVDKALAEQIVSMITRGLRGEINLAERVLKKELPPLPFSLGKLQAAASAEHGLTLKQVTEAAQNLYEKHKMISYVGTDCQFLPQSMLENARSTMASLSKLFYQQAHGANLNLVSKAWNDSKVDEHYAIIPTGQLPPSGLNENERLVYGTIARRYMSQFYPAYEYMKTSLGAVFGNDEFRASSREDKVLGWREIEGRHRMGSADDGTEIEVDADTQQQGMREGEQ